MLNIINTLFVIYSFNLKSFFNHNFLSTLSSYRDIYLYFFYFFNSFSGLFFDNFFNYFFIYKQQPQLLNVYCFYHPVLLYSYIYLFIKYRLCVYSCFCYFRFNNFFRNFKLVFFSITLSMLWSSQEVFWNGFWNWDMVEISLMNIFFCSVYYSHKRKNFFFKSYLEYYLITFLYFFFFLNKTGLIFSQHSFSSSFIFKVNISIIILIMFFIYTRLIILSFFFFVYDVILFYFLIFCFIVVYYSLYKYFLNVKVSYIFFKNLISVIFLISCKEFFFTSFLFERFLFFFTTVVIFRKKINVFYHFFYFLILFFFFKFYMSLNSNIWSLCKDLTFFSFLNCYLYNDSFFSDNSIVIFFKVYFFKNFIIFVSKTPFVDLLYSSYI